MDSRFRGNDESGAFAGMTAWAFAGMRKVGPCGDVGAGVRGYSDGGEGHYPHASLKRPSSLVADPGQRRRLAFLQRTAKMAAWLNHEPRSPSGSANARNRRRKRRRPSGGPNAGKRGKAGRSAATKTRTSPTSFPVRNPVPTTTSESCAPHAVADARSSQPPPLPVEAPGTGAVADRARHGRSRRSIPSPLMAASRADEAR